MLQVTNDLESRLYQLEQRMLRLVKVRDILLREANRMIKRGNREFDETAIPLGREINELRERLHRETNPAPKRTRKAPMLDGLDDDEQEHYRELLERRKQR